MSDTPARESVQGPTHSARQGASPTPTPTHPYNDRGISALEFLRRVMRDPNTELHFRIDAAHKLMCIGDPDNDIEWTSSDVTLRIFPVSGHA